MAPNFKFPSMNFSNDFSDEFFSQSPMIRSAFVLEEPPAIVEVIENEISVLEEDIEQGVSKAEDIAETEEIISNIEKVADVDINEGLLDEEIDSLVTDVLSAETKTEAVEAVERSVVDTVEVIESVNDVPPENETLIDGLEQEVIDMAERVEGSYGDLPVEAEPTTEERHDVIVKEIKQLDEVVHEQQDPVVVVEKVE